MEDLNKYEITIIVSALINEIYAQTERDQIDQHTYETMRLVHKLSANLPEDAREELMNQLEQLGAVAA